MTPFKSKIMVILAAGRGRRMRHLTRSIPKPLLKFKNKYLIDYVIEQAPKGAVICVTVGYKAHMIKNHLNQRIKFFIDTKGRGNAYFIFSQIIKDINKPIIVVPSDIKFQLDWSAIFRDYIRLGEPSCLIIPLFCEKIINADQIQLLENSNISCINREVDCNTPYYCSGIQLLNPLKINQWMNPVDDFYTVWENLIACQEIRISKINVKNWVAFDTPEQLFNSNEYIEEHLSRF